MADLEETPIPELTPTPTPISIQDTPTPAMSPSPEPQAAVEESSPLPTNTPTPTPQEAPQPELAASADNTLLFEADALAVLQTAPDLETGYDMLHKAYTAEEWKDPAGASKVMGDYAQELRYRFQDKSKLEIPEVIAASPIKIADVAGETNVEKLDNWEAQNLAQIEATTDPDELLLKNQLIDGVKNTASYYRRADQGGQTGFIMDKFYRATEGLVGGPAKLLGMDDFARGIYEKTNPDREDGIEGFIGALASGAGSVGGIVGSTMIAGPAGGAAYLAASGAGEVRGAYEDALKASGDPERALGAGLIETGSQVLQTLAGEKVFVKAGQLFKKSLGGKAVKVLDEEAEALLKGATTVKPTHADKGFIKTVAIDAGIESIGEGGGQFLSNVASNYGANDWNKSLMEGVLTNAGVGGILGGGAGGLSYMSTKMVNKNTQELQLNEPPKVSINEVVEANPDAVINTPEDPNLSKGYDHTFYVSKEVAANLAELKNEENQDGSIPYLYSDGKDLRVKSGFVDDNGKIGNEYLNRSNAVIQTSSEAADGLVKVNVDTPKSLSPNKINVRYNVGEDVVTPKEVEVSQAEALKESQVETVPVMEPEVTEDGVAEDAPLLPKSQKEEASSPDDIAAAGPQVPGGSVGAAKLVETKESSLAKRMRVSPNVSESVRDMLSDDAGNPIVTYAVKPNDQSLNSAFLYRNTQGLETSLKYLLNKDPHSHTAEDVSLGVVLLDELRRAESAYAAEGNTATNEKLHNTVIDLYTHVAAGGSSRGQANQAMIMYGKLNPDLLLMTMEGKLNTEAYEWVAAEDGVPVEDVKNIDDHIAQADVAISNVQQEATQNNKAEQAVHDVEIQDSQDLIDTITAPSVETHSNYISQEEATIEKIEAQKESLRQEDDARESATDKIITDTKKEFETKKTKLGTLQKEIEEGETRLKEIQESVANPDTTKAGLSEEEKAEATTLLGEVTANRKAANNLEQEVTNLKTILDSNPNPKDARVHTDKIQKLQDEAEVAISDDPVIVKITSQKEKLTSEDDVREASAKQVIDEAKKDHASKKKALDDIQEEIEGKLEEVKEIQKNAADAERVKANRAERTRKAHEIADAHENPKIKLQIKKRIAEFNESPIGADEGLDAGEKARLKELLHEIPSKRKEADKAAKDLERIQKVLDANPDPKNARKNDTKLDSLEALTKKHIENKVSNFKIKIEKLIADDNARESAASDTLTKAKQAHAEKKSAFDKLTKELKGKEERLKKLQTKAVETEKTRKAKAVDENAELKKLLKDVPAKKKEAETTTKDIERIQKALDAKPEAKAARKNDSKIAELEKLVATKKDTIKKVKPEDFLGKAAKDKVIKLKKAIADALVKKAEVAAKAKLTDEQKARLKELTRKRRELSQRKAKVDKLKADKKKVFKENAPKIKAAIEGAARATGFDAKQTLLDRAGNLQDESVALGKNKGSFWRTAWLANILTSVGVQMGNLKGNTLMAFVYAAALNTGEVFHGRLTGIEFMKGFYNAISSGKAYTAFAATMTGVDVYRGGIDKFGLTPTKKNITKNTQHFDLLNDTDPNHWLSKVGYGKINALELQKLAGHTLRLLAATDAFFYTSNKEGIAQAKLYRDAKMGKIPEGKSMAQHIAESMFNSKEEYAKALLHAERDAQLLHAAGLPKQSKLEIQQRAYEIAEQNRSEMLRNASDLTSQRISLTNKPYGAIGNLAQGLNEWAEKSDYSVTWRGKQYNIPTARYVVNFTNIGSNVLNELLNYTPIGLGRANTDPLVAPVVKKIQKLQETIDNHTKANKPVPNSITEKLETANKELETIREETGLNRSEYIGKVLIGTMAMGTLAAFFLSTKPDDKDNWLDINGAGPKDYEKNKQWKEQGNEAYSFRVGDHLFKYADTPLAGVLGLMGAIRDGQRWDSNFDPTTASGLFAITNSAFLGAFLDNSFMKTFTDLLGNIKDSASGRGNPNFLGNMGLNVAKGFIPFIGTQKDIAAMVDDPIDTTQNLYSKLLQGIPFVERIGSKPALNGFGKPIEQTIPDRLRAVSRFYNTKTDDPNWRWLGTGGYFLPKIDDKITVEVGKHVTDSREEKLGRRAAGVFTPEEMYEYVKEQGPATEAIVTKYRNRYPNSSGDKKIQDRMKEEISAARKRIEIKLARSSIH